MSSSVEIPLQEKEREQQHEVELRLCLGLFEGMWDENTIRGA